MSVLARIEGYNLTPYSSWTATRSTLDMLQRASWRLLMSPETLKRCRGKVAPTWTDGSAAPYCLDNGAWSAHLLGEPFPEEAFLWALERIGEESDWVVIPDSVGNTQRTLEMAEAWYPSMSSRNLLLAVQDGMTAADVLPWMERGVGVFIGGTTEFKLSTMGLWSRLARAHGQICHVGRVNTVRRIRICQRHRVTSFDGSSVARFSVTLRKLNDAVRYRGKQARLL